MIAPRLKIAPQITKVHFIPRRSTVG
jgi:hypothetical protein